MVGRRLARRHFPVAFVTAFDDSHRAFELNAIDTAKPWRRTTPRAFDAHGRVSTKPAAINVPQHCKCLATYEHRTAAYLERSPCGGAGS